MERGKEGKVPHSCLPITPAILRKIKLIRLDQVPLFNSVMLCTGALVTFLSFCRSGEITVEGESKYDAKTHLSWVDVAVDNVE